MRFELGLTVQAAAIVAALEEIPELASVGYLDDENQTNASPSRMPAAWVALDRIEQDEVMARAFWAVTLRVKRLAGLVRPAGETPALTLVELIVKKLRGRRVATNVTPLDFAGAEYMEPLVESAVYLIRFSAQIHTGRAIGACPNLEGGA